MVTIKFIINRKKRGRESDMFQGEKKKTKKQKNVNDAGSYHAGSAAAGSDAGKDGFRCK